MLPDQFFYWLQGYFEIANTDADLTTDQAECIGRHIDLVTTWAAGDGARRDPIPVPDRIIEIRTLLSLLSTDPALITGRIRDTINAQFMHVIDPKAGGPTVQNKLNEIHGGHPPRPGEPVYRC